MIITLNEEENLQECLDSVKPVADEIIVVDSYSTDGTVGIAKANKAVVVQHSFDGYVQQRNFAMEQATYDMILALDADERLSGRAVELIKEIKLKGAGAKAYSLNRLNNYCGKWIRHCGWYPEKKVRLWDKRYGRLGGVNPHDSVIMDKEQPVGHINADILHYSYRNISSHIKQMDKFSSIAAEENFKLGKRANVIIHLVLYPFWIFLKMYFVKLGFLDGFYGFMISVNGAYYRFLKYAKLINLK